MTFFFFNSNYILPNYQIDVDHKKFFYKNPCDKIIPQNKVISIKEKLIPMNFQYYCISR